MQLLSHDFLQALRSKLEPLAGSGAPPPWQQLELVCFATRSLHAELKGLLSRELEGAADPPAQQALAAHKAAVRELLAALLTPIAQGGFNSQPPALRSAAVRLVGCFGKLLATEHGGLLEVSPPLLILFGPPHPP